MDLKHTNTSRKDPCFPKMPDRYLHRVPTAASGIRANRRRIRRQCVVFASSRLMPH